MDIDSFLNNQILDFHTQRSFNSNKVDLDIIHLEDDIAHKIIDGDTIQFSTHNILGMDEKSDPIKSSQIFEHCRINTLDFISLTETHHKNSMFYKHNKDDDYTSYWSKPDSNEPYAGVRLLVLKKWSPTSLVLLWLLPVIYMLIYF